MVSAGSKRVRAAEIIQAKKEVDCGDIPKFEPGLDEQADGNLSDKDIAKYAALKTRLVRDADSNIITRHASSNLSDTRLTFRELCFFCAKKRDVDDSESHEPVQGKSDFRRQIEERDSHTTGSGADKIYSGWREIKK